MGSLNKVEPGKLKGKPGNSLKSLNQADNQPYFLVYQKLNKAENADFQSYAAGRCYITMLKNAENSEHFTTEQF